MELIYATKETEELCTNKEIAQKKLGKRTAQKLMKTINYLESVETLKDVILFRRYRFHNLTGDKEGKYAIDIDTIKSSYRLIIEPLDENRRRFKKEDNKIHLIGNKVNIISIEVSKHYER